MRTPASLRSVWLTNWINAPKFRVLVSGLLAAAAGSTVARPPVELPIFLEDSHAGSFYWIAENVPLDTSHTLVLFDAHSDASEVFDSDVVREELRKPRDMAQLRKVTRRWRESGVIQCFNWIEPLMPAPLAEVIWVSPGEMTDERRQQLLAEVEAELNAHEIVAPRAGESLTPRFTVASLEELAEREFAHPIIVSLDLDYFAESDGEDFGEVWKAVLNLPDLRAITAAISTPYLKSLDQADALVTQFWDAATRITNATIEYDPEATIGPDHSRRARDLARAGEEIPAFVPKSRKLLAQMLGKGPEIFVAGATPDFDGCYRLNADDGFKIRLREDAEEVGWVALDFEHDVYNLMGEDAPFAAGAPWVQRLKSKPLADGRIWLDERDVTPHLDPELGCGTIRVQATVGGVPTNTLILRVSKSSGFRGAIEESFNLPYVLGSSLLSGGPDRAEGGDCANLAVYALRRSQHCQLPWSTPLQFERLCSAIEEFTAEEVETGLFVSFGTHLGVLWEDLPPLGEFNAEDRFGHHLEGRPEILTLAQLAEGRREAKFLKLKRKQTAATLVFGGDVMLARTIGERIQLDAAFDPFSHIGDTLRKADLAFVNLECALTDPRPGPDKTFVFQAPPAAVRVLTRAGIDAVSLSNNHSHDGGENGFMQTYETLKAVGIGWFGGAVHSTHEVNGVHIAIVGFEPGDDLASIRHSSQRFDTVIVMTHWGIENTRQITDGQRVLAQQLLDAGADLIVGSGPHAPQADDRRFGKPVFYSMGNLVFDDAGPGPDWRRGYLVKVCLDDRGRVLSAEKEPYEFSD